MQRLAELSPRARAPWAVLSGILAEISMYSRLDDRMSVGRLEQVTGLDRRSVQRGLAYLVDHGIVVRFSDPPVPGKATPTAWIALPAAPSEQHRQDEIDGDEIEWDDAPSPPSERTPVPVSGDAPQGGWGDAPSEKYNFSEKKDECASNGNFPLRAREVGRADGPPSRPPGERTTDALEGVFIPPPDDFRERWGSQAHHPGTEGLCDEARAAHDAALARQAALLAGGVR